MRILRILRLFRILRILKLARYTEELGLLIRVFQNKREQLYLTLFFLLMLLVVASSLMYYAENRAQPDEFSSIPAAMWWGIATLTTVGYGDVYPITTIGRVMGAVIAILGIGMFALPAGILSSGLLDEIQKGKQAIRACPHCGKDIEG